MVLPFLRKVSPLVNFESKKRQILDHVDLHALVSEHVTLRRTGKRWVGLCPFHSEKTPSFSVSPDIGVFKCFGCGKGGDVFSFIQYRENVTFMESMRILADRAGVELDEPRQGSGNSQAGDSVGRAEVSAACSWGLAYYRSNLAHESLGRSVRQYLHQRGFTDQTIDQFGLGLAIDGAPSLRSNAAAAGLASPVLEAADLIRASDDGRFYDTFRNRIIFPIRDASGRVIGFGGRTLIDDRAKYLNTRQNVLFDKGRGLYSVDLARQAIAERGRAIVVEGYTDCMACHQAGLTETVATLGTALTEAQVDLLRRYCGEIVLVFDSDVAGAEAADRALRVALPRGIKVRIAHVPEGKDPGEFLIGPDAAARFLDVLNTAPDALELTWRQTVSRFQADASDVQRREAVVSFVRLVGEASGAEALDAIQRGLLVNQVAHLLRMDRNEVGRLMAATGSSRNQVPSFSMENQNLRRPATPIDGEQAAWETVLEVLLQEPGLIGNCLPQLDVSRIQDARNRRIAMWMVDATREFGEFGVSDVLVRSDTPADSERIAELVHRGELRGNPASLLRAAVDRIQSAVREEELECTRRRLFEDKEEGSGPDARQDLADYQDGLRNHRRFGPRRIIRGTASASISGPTGGEAPESATTTEST